MNKYFENTIKHFKKICVHKYWVFRYCLKMGIPVQGILHDLSKFSPTEFFESVKYYQGDRSPIDACKEVNGWSKAWMHHKGRNKHHYEHWVDNLDKGGEVLEMPLKYKKEMLCDYLGAGRTYHGEKFTYKKELDWWKKKLENPIAMNKEDKKYISMCLNILAEYGDRGFKIIKRKEMM